VFAPVDVDSRGCLARKLEPSENDLLRCSRLLLRPLHRVAPLSSLYSHLVLNSQQDRYPSQSSSGLSGRRRKLSFWTSCPCSVLEYSLPRQPLFGSERSAHSRTLPVATSSSSSNPLGGRTQRWFDFSSLRSCTPPPSSHHKLNDSQF
jgi:hypothetical protein